MSNSNNDLLKRKFLDNIKRSDVEVHKLLFDNLKDYINERNIYFRKFNGLDNEKYKDFNVINMDEISNIRESYGYDTSKINSCSRRNGSFSLVSSICDYFNHSNTQLALGNLFYLDYAFNIKYIKFDWNKIRNISMKYIQYYIYDSLVNMIPLLYKYLSNILFEKLEISKDDYYIQFDKLYDVNDLKKKFSCESYFDKWSHIFEPCLNVSFSKLYNIQNGDIYDFNKDKEFGIGSRINRSYYYNNSEYDSPSVTIFPFTDSLIFKVSGEHYNPKRTKGNVFDYTYNRLPKLTINEFNEENREVINEYDFNKYLPLGYFGKTITIANILNYLYCIIVNKQTDEKFIIQFNQFGIKPTIVHSATSIKSVISYNRKNLNNLVNNELLENRATKEREISELISKYKYEFNETKLNSINENLFNNYKAFVINEIDNKTLYNNKLAKEPIMDDQDRIANIFPTINFDSNFTKYPSMSVSKSLKSYIPTNINSFMRVMLGYVTRISGSDIKNFTFDKDKRLITTDLFKEISYNDYKKYMYNEYKNKYMLFGNEYTENENNYLIDFENIYWIKYAYNDQNNPNKIYLTMEEKLEKLTTREGIRDLYNNYYTNNYRFKNNSDEDYIINNIIIVTQYIKPFLNTYINSIICPILKDEYKNELLYKAFEKYKELEEITKKIKKEKDEIYKSYSTDSISQFAQEANYFNTNLGLTTIHLFSLYKD